MESHCNDPSERYGEYKFNSDEEAKEWLEKEKKKPSNGYSKLWMYRIDIKEEKTHIA